MAETKSDSPSGHRPPASHGGIYEPFATPGDLLEAERRRVESARNRNAFDEASRLRRAQQMAEESQRRKLAQAQLERMRGPTKDRRIAIAFLVLALIWFLFGGLFFLGGAVSTATAETVFQQLHGGTFILIGVLCGVSGTITLGISYIIRAITQERSGLTE